MADEGVVVALEGNFIEKLKEADEALDKMVQSVDNVANSLNKLASGGLTKFAAMIDRITGTVVDLSETKVGDLGFTDASNIAAKAVDNVNNAVKSINKIVENRVSETIADAPMLIDTKALEKEVSALDAAIKKTEEKRAAHKAKLKVLENAGSAHSKIRDAQASVDTDKKDLARLRRKLKSVQTELEKATANNKAALERMLTQSVEGFIPIGTIKANINELNKMIHEVPSLYPDPVEQQHVVDQLIALKEKYKDAMKSSGQKFDEVEKERIAQQKIVQIAEAADEREAASNKKKAQQIVDNFIKETEAARKSYEDRRQMYTSLWNEQEREERTTFEGAMKYSKETASINEQIQAIKYLKEARDKLNKTELGEEEYEKQVEEINKELERQNEILGKLTNKHKGLKNEQAALSEATSRLMGLLSTAFSIHAIKGYVNQVMRVRGEFELQQRSLQALLQSKGEANKLWNQTIQLALKSPFQVKELITYTKQLAAYRVETEKLHDTTKMLADISAGLGVDMSRLILAFGQVKAANYLRGTELRQFSEAGINILDELARYYTALEGKTVTVGQVFERVSKRMVSFADVEKVLQKVTSAGGMFYKMQEEQADTLKGQISNLKDQMDLMLNDIGERNEAVMKSGVKVASWLIKNYKLLIPVLSMGAAGFAAMQISMLKAKIGTEALAAGVKSLRAVMLSPWTVLLVGVSALVAEIIRYENKLKQIEKAHQKFNDSMIDIQAELNDAMNTNKIDDARVALNKLLETAKKDFKIDLGLSPEEINKLDTDAIAAKFAEIRQKVFDAEIISKQLAEGFAWSESWDTGFWRGLVSVASMGAMQPTFDQGLTKDVEQYQAAADKLVSTIQKLGLELAANADVKLPPEHPLRVAQDAEEGDLEYLERLLNALKPLRHDHTVINAKIDFSAVDKAIEEYNSRMSDAEKEARLFLEKTLGDTASLAPEMIEAGLNNFINNNQFWTGYKDDLLRKLLGFESDAEQQTNVTPVVDTEGQNQDTRNYWNELTETVKKVNDAYKDLNKTFDDTTAKQGAVEKYTEALDDVLSKIVIDGKKLDASSFMEMFDLTTEEGMLKALDMIAKEAPEAADKLKAKLEKGEITWEAKIKVKEDEDKKLTNLVDDLFSGYELSIELDKLNIPADFAQDFFNIEVTSLESLRSKLESMKGLFVGQNMTDEYEKYIKKLNDMERKAQEERLKTYLQYARDAVGERAKIKLEELRKLQEIEETFDKEHEPEKQAAIKKVQEDSYQATQKLEWEEFQKSDTFIGLFEDLDSASSALTEHMIKKLEDFKAEWKNMPLEDMKSIVDKINQLRTHLVEQDAFKWGKELRSKVKEDGRSEAEIQEENIAEEERISEYDREIELLQTILRLKEEGKAVQALAYAGSQDAAEMSALNVSELRKEIKEREKARKKSKETVDNNKQALKDQQDLRKAYAAQAQYIQEGQKMANDLYDAFSDIMDVLGQGDGMGAIFAQMGMDMANSVLTAFALRAQLKAATVDAHTFGAAMNAAMGIVGWIVMGVQLISAAFKAVFAAHDKNLEKQIQQLAENVEYLQSRFEEFEKALDKAFSTTQIESFTKALSNNIDRQIANYERMRKLEEDKKKTDQSKIDEYNDAIKDLSEQRKEIFEEQQSNATAGILDDALSAAEEFVDAWYEAFKETGDGLSGLRENFKEMLTDLIKKQAALQIVGHYTKMYSDWLAGYIDVAGGDAMLTADEAKEWAAKVKETMPELNAMLENFFSGTQELLQEEGSLSELSKGIQGVTESTAQVLEALLNSMRFYVADSNTQLKAIAASFASNDVERNPLLNELRQQTALIRSIESMFDSVIGRGGSAHIGGYIKVKID